MIIQWSLSKMYGCVIIYLLYYLLEYGAQHPIAIWPYCNTRYVNMAICIAIQYSTTRVLEWYRSTRVRVCVLECSRVPVYRYTSTRVPVHVCTYSSSMLPVHTRVPVCAQTRRHVFYTCTYSSSDRMSNRSNGCICNTTKIPVHIHWMPSISTFVCSCCSIRTRVRTCSRVRVDRYDPEHSFEQAETWQTSGVEKIEERKVSRVIRSRSKNRCNSCLDLAFWSTELEYQHRYHSNNSQQPSGDASARSHVAVVPSLTQSSTPQAFV